MVESELSDQNISQFSLDKDVKNIQKKAMGDDVVWLASVIVFIHFDVGISDILNVKVQCFQNGRVKQWVLTGPG